MSERFRAILAVILFAALAAAGYLGARHWQASQAQYARVAPAGDCDLRAGACGRAVGGGRVEFAISPATIPLMQVLQLTVRTEDLHANAVEVDIRGLNMDMGLNRSQLRRIGEGHWQGEAILPVCSQRRMEWEAAVRVDAGGGIEVPFPFHTTR